MKTRYAHRLFGQITWLLPASYLICFAVPAALHGEPLVITERLHHLRSAEPREWSEFPEQAEATELRRKFSASANQSEHALRLRQQDVKRNWQVSLNGQRLGQLHTDENDMIVYYNVPPGTLVEGTNELLIRTDDRAAPDDVRIGEIWLDPRPIEQVLHEATVQVRVLDGQAGQTVPARITIIEHNGALQTAGAQSNAQIAVRPGVIYALGPTKFGLPAGRYSIYAGRGFEYSLDQATVQLEKGQSQEVVLRIQRQVPTDGYVACDTHVHTLTYSGHGDATLEERMVTLAGEGIELPIATDHNVHADYQEPAVAQNVRQYFTPVIGNEVTTAVGHFNVFPIERGARPPNHRLTDWQPLFREIFSTPGVRVAILNHARDLHGGTRPFGPELYNAVVGENLEGWQLQANAMEVINSGATQTDVMQLFHDWMGLLNRGRFLTPAGSSDSHDVARHFVGQGRTYIRARDTDPSQIDVHEAVDNFLQGHVMVSYGLLTELTVNDKYTSGDLVPAPPEELQVAVRVLGPDWTDASAVRLYANGQLVREAELKSGERSAESGVLWKGGWSLPRPSHDVHLVAIAVGPGIQQSYWKTAKPYQPTSPDWQPQTIGCSGAVWIDVDGDGRRTSAHDYAQRIFGASEHQLEAALKILADYDEAVAAQTANLFQEAGQALISDEVQQTLSTATAATQAGFRAYINSWRASQQARAGH